MVQSNKKETKQEIKFICDWIDYYDKPEQLIKYKSSNVHESKEKILEYLKSEKFKGGIYCSLLYDKIANKHLGEYMYSYSDGEYTWSTRDIFYYEKYNLELKKEFTDRF